ncbi:hypothetical protein F1654_09020 [Alkalicaulis satelles]|uniref:Uncharacterized protein n=1 Tax=Alkalicaulis satelles TaxID=2609175 RepID=A0A5M6ZGM8_9PROT|nr:hypothetical protein [Alkalicaulis satelles]KAA5803926.1 hypothetical protein F1654_09020 [Alkalicaulis satelles]
MGLSGLLTAILSLGAAQAAQPAVTEFTIDMVPLYDETRTQTGERHHCDFGDLPLAVLERSTRLGLVQIDSEDGPVWLRISDVRMGDRQFRMVEAPPSSGAPRAGRALRPVTGTDLSRPEGCPQPD